MREFPLGGSDSSQKRLARWELEFAVGITAPGFGWVGSFSAGNWSYVIGAGQATGKWVVVPW
jgi:hypothetical protein